MGHPASNQEVQIHSAPIPALSSLSRLSVPNPVPSEKTTLFPKCNPSPFAGVRLESKHRRAARGEERDLQICKREAPKTPGLRTRDWGQTGTKTDSRRRPIEEVIILEALQYLRAGSSWHTSNQSDTSSSIVPHRISVPFPFFFTGD